MTLGGDLPLAESEVLAGRYPELLHHQVHRVHGLGHRVLDLQPGVHLQEEEVALRVDELDGAGVDVADRPGGGDRDPAHALPGGRVDHHRRRLLEDLLVAALDRALALPEVDHVAVGVGEHLDLDVPRLLHVALQEDGGVAEGALRPSIGRPPGLLSSSAASRATRMPMPPPPAEALMSTG